MKKVFLIFCVILLGFNVNFTYSDNSDYTLIDCIDGNDSTGVAFDSTKPYQTLKGGIERTIGYINSSSNKPWSENTASGKVFNIKVKCTMNDMLDSSIKLNFNGLGYNNELVIEGIDDKSFLIQNITFSSNNSTGYNIVFKNANFIGAQYKKYYFTSLGTIKIIDSQIDLKAGENLGSPGIYKPYSQSPSHFFYFNKILLENTLLNIEISDNYTFGVPSKIKNSKIVFKSLNPESVQDINFHLLSTSTSGRSLSNYSLISNEIDFGGNNFITQNDSDIVFINNKILNFGNFNLSKKVVYINNYFENKSSMDISNFRNMYNNIFQSGFEDTYDIYNLRKNYDINNIGKKGVAWVFKKASPYKYFNIDTSSHKLYKEITGKTLAKIKNSIYVIYQQ